MTTKRANTYRLAGAATAALCALGLSACSSTNKTSSSATVPSTVVPSTSTTSAGSAQGSTVCTDIKAAAHALGSINLDSPSSIESNASTVAADVSKLDSDVGNSAYAPNGSSEQAMVGDVRNAIAQGETAASQLSKGNAGNAKNAFQAMKTDLQNARSAGAQAHLSACS